jgi:hypothetical protein
MHNGPLVMLRMLLLYAKPWQQVLVCARLRGHRSNAHRVRPTGGRHPDHLRHVFSLPTLPKPVYKTWIIKTWIIARRRHLVRGDARDGSR